MCPFIERSSILEFESSKPARRAEKIRELVGSFTAYRQIWSVVLRSTIGRRYQQAKLSKYLVYSLLSTFATRCGQMEPLVERYVDTRSGGFLSYVVGGKLRGVLLIWEHTKHTRNHLTRIDYVIPYFK